MPAADNILAIDDVRVERWAGQIVSNDLSDIAATFLASYGEAPRVEWNPRREDLRHERLQFLLAHWENLRRGRALPHVKDIDPLEIGPVLGYVALTDPVDEGRDFRYRLYGSTLAAISGFDMTGRLLSTLNASPLMVELLVATYRAAYRRREPVYIVRAPRRTAETAYWHSVCLPLTDDSGAVARLLIAAMPLAHDGRLLTAWL